MVEEDCVFCKIIKKEIPAEIVEESENFIVIKDIRKLVDGHSLVIPKKHYKTLLDMPSSLYSEFLDVVKDATFKLLKDTGAEGFNLVMNNFEAAGQVVRHAHLHILPRKKDDGLHLTLGDKGV